MTNSTYRKKYQPLPPDTPVPKVHIAPGKWMFWELWAGTGHLTKAVSRLGLTCGPPITKELGWDLSLASHQQALMKMYLEHEPEIVFGAPVCGPWSQSNTNMDPTIKDLLRKEQMEAFLFFHRLVQLQHENHRYFLIENPRSSELLNQPLCLDLLKKYGGNDKVTRMCSHGLMDIDSGKSYMKQTTLRGDVSLHKSIRWCKCTTSHELMQGHNRNGSLRTASA